MTRMWLTVEDAADILGVSTSTIYRRVKADKLESRQNDDGITEVLVETDDENAHTSADPASELRARAKQDNSDEQIRANPWLRATRPGDALLADQRAKPQAEAERRAASHTTPTPPHAVAEKQRDEAAGATPTPTPTLNSDPTTTDGAARLVNELANNDPATAAQLANATPLSPADVENTSPNDELARFQKLAGASVMLAQRQADDAKEQIARARHEAYRLRRLCYASWLATAAALVLAFGLTLGFGYAASSATARADAAERIANQAAAQQAARTAAVAYPQAATPQDRADPAPASRFDRNTTADVRRAPFE